MKRVSVLIPIIVLASLIGYRLVQKKADVAAQASQRAARMKAAPAVSFSMARLQDVAQSFESVGSVEAPLNVKIAVKVTGRIQYLEAREGDRVTSGQVLVRIDPAQVEAQVRQAEAALAEAQYRLAQAKLTQNSTNASVDTQVRQQEQAVAAAEAAVANIDAAIRSAQANLTNATAKYNRVKTLYDKGFIAAQDVDDAKTAVGVQQAALDAVTSQRKGVVAQREQARSALEYAKVNTAQKPAYEQSLAALRASAAVAGAGLKSAEALRADLVLTAPFDGFVTDRLVDPGAVVMAGQPILAVQYMRRVWVTVSVPEEVDGTIAVGQAATVTLDSMRGRTFVGKITQVNPSADPASRQFSVRVTLDNPSFAIKPGTFAHVRIETGKVRDAVVVPREAVEEDREGTFVNVIDDNDTASRRPVKVGASSADVIAITSGLRPGEKVVTLSAFPIKDGQPVSTGGEKKKDQGRRR